VHKRESQIYILAEGGEVIEQRIRTEAERFAAEGATRTSRRSSDSARRTAGRSWTSGSRSASPGKI